MWYSVNYKKLVVLLLPGFLRKPKLIGYLQALIAPIDQLYYKWSNFRKDNLYKLEHTGQVCSFEKSLNDKFDPMERRIYLGEGNIYDTEYIYTEAEFQDVFIETEAEDDTLWLYTESETADNGIDFIVFVPKLVFDTQIYGLHAHVKYYKAGGKRYEIRIIS